ncbi:hypothetical protein LJR225_002683 [Phenylobacterium sp. LjRoot225]|uniref:hypothetical protein n=1 Tax=Phenylobacterium sp. LjRoot225 TaxID=3342285 RepID=UPI003ED00313
MFRPAWDAPSSRTTDGAAGSRIRRVLLEGLTIILAAALLGWAAMADRAWIDRHFLPEFRTDRSLPLTVVAWGRILATCLALTLVVIVRPQLGRLGERRTLASLLAAAAPTALAVVLAVGAAELILRVAEHATDPPKTLHRESLQRSDAEIGWTSRPNRTGYDQAAGRRILYAFDAHGLRVGAPGQVVDLTRPSVVFAGESIMLGDGLPWEETAPAQVQAMTGLQAVDLAYNGYAVDQAYMRLRRDIGAVAHPAAIVTLFLPSAFFRMLERDRPHLDADLRWRPAAGEWRLARAFRRLAPYRSAAEIEQGVRAARAALRATAALAQEREAQSLIIVPILEPESPQEAALRRRVLDEGGIDYIQIPIPPNERLKGDAHPNAQGARSMARAIRAALRLENDVRASPHIARNWLRSSGREPPPG